jgi:hypothetical protein
MKISKDGECVVGIFREGDDDNILGERQGGTETSYIDKEGFKDQMNLERLLIIMMREREDYC